jgi:AraC-like DNA-binding protein
MTLPDIKTTVFRPAEELRSCIIQYSLMDIYAENYAVLKVKTFPTSLAGIGIGLNGSKMQFLNYENNINDEYGSSVIGTYPIESKTYLSASQIKTRWITIVLSHEGVNRLLGIPMHELCNVNISLDCLYGNEFNHLTEQLEEESDDLGLIRCLNKFFIRKVRLSKIADHQAIFRVMKLFNGSSALSSVKELASQMNMHIRTLERLFSTDLGLTPKELLRIRRFILLKDYVIRYQETHWTDLIVKCGFYDQAHLNHEISKVTNLTPIEFFQIARCFKN